MNNINTLWEKKLIKDSDLLQYLWHNYFGANSRIPVTFSDLYCYLSYFLLPINLLLSLIASEGRKDGLIQLKYLELRRWLLTFQNRNQWWVTCVRFHLFTGSPNIFFSTRGAFSYWKPKPALTFGFHRAITLSRICSYASTTYLVDNHMIVNQTM